MRTMLKRTNVILYLLYFILSINGISFSMSEGILKFDAESEIIINGEPILGEEFTVTYRFTPKQNISHTKGIMDTVILRSKPNVLFLSGDTLWTGSLQKDVNYSLEAIYRVDTPIVFNFSGVMKAQQVLGELAIIDDKTDQGTRAFNTAKTKVIDLRDSDEPFVVIERLEYGPDSSLVIAGHDTIPYSVINPPVAVATTDKSFISNESSLVKTPSSASDTNIVCIDLEILESGKKLKLYKDKVNIIKVIDKSNAINL